nr:hypothetical protein [Tanacetum cinerariifolium]
FTTLRVNSPSFSGRIVPLFDTMLVHQGKGSGTPTEPHHTRFPEVESSHPTTSSIPLPSIPTAPIPTVTQPDTTPIIQYSRRARIAQSSALPTGADEPASPVRDAQEEEIGRLKERVQALEDREGSQVSKSTEKANDQEAEEGILYGSDQKQLGLEVEDFIPMGSKEESERLKRKGLNLEKEKGLSTQKRVSTGDDQLQASS